MLRNKKLIKISVIWTKSLKFKNQVHPNNQIFVVFVRAIIQQSALLKIIKYVKNLAKNEEKP